MSQKNQFKKFPETNLNKYGALTRTILSHELTAEVLTPQKSAYD
jgi:hypothetical protein